VQLAIVLLGVALGGCGGESKSAHSASRTASTLQVTNSTTSTDAPTTNASNATHTTRPHKDSNDSDEDPESNDDNAFLYYGHAASEADKRSVTTLVTNYYTAAAADDGVKACSLIYAIVAEALPEEYAQSPEASGKTCAEVMSKVFKNRHSQMVADRTALKVTSVRVDGKKGLAFVYLGKVPEPYVLLHREAGGWKMESLFEIGLP
jgi:hypothetical protein